MFVRKRPSGNQLIESYRGEDGKPRQRVVFYLDQHETPEAALAEAEAELAELEGRAQAAEARVERNAEDWVKPRWQHGLDEWHGGEIPPLEEVIEQARNAQHTGYDDAFVGLHGDDLSEFIWDLRNLEELKAKAAAVRKDVEPHAILLRKRIELLRSVVSE